MRSIRKAVLIATVLGCAPAPASLTDSHAAAIRDSTTAFLENFRRLSAAAKWDSMAMQYSDDRAFLFIENGEVRYRSSGAIREALGGVPAGTRIETSFTDPDITALAPGLAEVGTLFQTTFRDSTGAQFQFGGALSLLLRHEPTGWRILRGHSSAPVPRR